MTIMATKRNTRRNKRGAMAALSLIALVTMPPHMQPQEQTIPYPEIQYEIPEEPLIFSENEQKVIQFPLIPTIEVNPKLEIYRDGKKEGTYHSIDQAREIMGNMKLTSPDREYKIKRGARNKMAGPPF